MNMKTIGLAPNDSTCDCERTDCHRGNCTREAFFLVEAYGMKQRLCAQCFRIARLATA